MSKHYVAIVGRPNVGKSMLFNKLTGQRTAIVEDSPGVTRDRIYGKCEWNGRSFELIDTGGIEPSTGSEMLQFMRRQAEIAIETAEVIIMVTDVKVGVTAADMEVANLLKRSRKPVVVAVNKCDAVGPMNPEVFEFYDLGLGDPVETSAIHGHGTGDLLDFITEHLSPDEEEPEKDEVVKVAIVGKPNVGKSSLLNRILGMERVIVSDEAGTTRDAVDSYFENEHGKFLFIDTAGMRRKSKVDDAIEKYSNMRSIAAIDRADVVLILINAGEGVTEQDTKIAGLAHEAGKASILVVNKWDAVEKDTHTMDRMTEEVRKGLSYMTYAPILFISAKTGQRVDRLYELINYVNEQSALRITTGMLNSLLADATARVQPPTDKGRRLKIFYATQAGVKPPHFIFFCNDARLFHFSYQRYLENQIRAVFGLEGTPVKITVRQRSDKEE
ncbi:MAG: ribosome biogenesis GTPase Der [Oscillospiraceae bacterium]|nr:ribosome biogenesis GTPase Der [Oscillospiraceae bacterium]